MNLSVIIATLSYLLAAYWPYMVAALVIGLGAGWFGTGRSET